MIRFTTHRPEAEKIPSTHGEVGQSSTSLPTLSSVFTEALQQKDLLTSGVPAGCLPTGRWCSKELLHGGNEPGGSRARRGAQPGTEPGPARLRRRTPADPAAAARAAGRSRRAAAISPGESPARGRPAAGAPRLASPGAHLLSPPGGGASSATRLRGPAASGRAGLSIGSASTARPGAPLSPAGRSLSAPPPAGARLPAGPRTISCKTGARVASGPGRAGPNRAGPGRRSPARGSGSFGPAAGGRARRGRPAPRPPPGPRSRAASPPRSGRACPAARGRGPAGCRRDPCGAPREPSRRGPTAPARRPAPRFPQPPSCSARIGGARPALPAPRRRSEGGAVTWETAAGAPRDERQRRRRCRGPRALQREAPRTRPLRENRGEGRGGGRTAGPPEPPCRARFVVTGARRPGAPPGPARN